MKVTQKLRAMLLCYSVLITLLVSCTAPEVLDTPMGTQETQDVSFSIETDPDTLPDAEPEPEPQYNWIAEPGKISRDIRPIYNVMSNDLCGFGLSIASDGDSYSLVDSFGEIKGELDSDGYGYCAVCKGITNHNKIVDPETYVPKEYTGGHGGFNTAPYIYDTETGDIYEAYIGGYEKLEDRSGALVVQLCTKSPVPEEEKDLYNTDFVFEPATCYGLLIDGTLVQSNFEMYSRYSCGIVSLCRDGKWGYYDTLGNEILPCEYDPSTESLDNSLYEPVYVPYQASYGIIALSRFGKWGYADTDGNMLTGFEFDRALPVYKNRAWVKTEDGWGVIELDCDCAEISEEEIKEYLLDSYVTEDGSSLEYSGDTTYYETECKTYNVNGEYTYYVTTDGKVITAIYE